MLFPGRCLGPFVGPPFSGQRKDRRFSRPSSSLPRELPFALLLSRHFRVPSVRSDSLAWPSLSVFLSWETRYGYRMQLSAGDPKSNLHLFLEATAHRLTGFFALSLG